MAEVRHFYHSPESQVRIDSPEILHMTDVASLAPSRRSAQAVNTHMIDTMVPRDLDPKKRAAEKAASRVHDQRQLEAGEISVRELGQANSAFGSAAAGARIKSIGGKPIREAKGGR